jgi:hypothetical protein
LVRLYGPAGLGTPLAAPRPVKLDRRFVIALGVLGLLAHAVPARADDVGSDEPPAAAIRADVGVGSAVGFLGLALGAVLGDYAQIEAGVGLGASGLQLSLMPKLVLGSRRNHFLCGVGLSLAVPVNADESTGHPIWLNVDALGVEHLSKNGLAFLIAAGFMKGLGNGTACGDFVPCDEPGQLKDVTRILAPQFRLGVGYAF